MPTVLLSVNAMFVSSLLPPHTNYCSQNSLIVYAIISNMYFPFALKSILISSAAEQREA
jgi:hypothetical protein